MKRARPRPQPRPPLQSLRPANILRALFLRETATITHTAFRTAVYTALVPSNTFINVSNVPNVSFRRFTPCGRFLISISRNQRDIQIFRFQAGGRRTMPSNQSTLDFHCHPYIPPPPILNHDLNPIPNSFQPSSHSPFSPFPPAFTPNHPLNVDPFRPFPSDTAPPAPTDLPDQGLLTHVPVPLQSRPRRRDFSRDYSCDFSRFFTRHYELPVATGAETLSRDFCLCTPSGRYLIVASFHAQAEGAQVPERPVATDNPPGVANVPIYESVTLHLVEVESGRVADRFVLLDDFVQLDSHAGVHMRGNLLSVLSIRQQVLYILKIHEGAGRFVVQARIGDVCRLDDEFEVARARDTAGFRPQGDLEREAVLEKGLGNGRLSRGFYTGLMQKLLVHVYRRHEAEGYRERFYRVVGQYSMLVMLKAQLLDEEHVLIKLGTHERSGKASDAGWNTCFFLVYDMLNAKVVRLFENSSRELLEVYERHRDIFVGDRAVLASLRALRTGRDEESWRNLPKSAASASATRTRTALAALPIASQVRNGSIYLDRSIFSYTMDRIAALDGIKAYVSREHSPVKFMSVLSGRLRFKLAAGVPSGERARRDFVEMDGEEERELEARTRRKKAVFLFHPWVPFVLSMEFCLSTATVVNFHAYGQYN